MEQEKIFVRWRGGFIWITLAILLTIIAIFITIPTESNTAADSSAIWWWIVALVTWLMAIPRTRVSGNNDELTIKNLWTKKIIPWEQITALKIIAAHQWDLPIGGLSDGLILEIYTTESSTKPFVSTVTIAVAKRHHKALVTDLETYRQTVVSPK